MIIDSNLKYWRRDLLFDSFSHVWPTSGGKFCQNGQNNIFSKHELVLARTFKIVRLESKVVVSGCAFFAFLSKFGHSQEANSTKIAKDGVFFLNMSLYGLEVLKGRL